MGRKKLLIMDSEVWYLAELQQAGYRILLAGDSGDAIRLISCARQAGKDFDLIIADMIALNLSSPGLAKNRKGLKIKEGDNSIPVCAVSAYRNNEENMELFYEGCNAYISDPFEPARLLEFVDDVLNSSH